jgi:PAS domain-containing protein
VFAGALAFVVALVLELGVWRWLADRSLREASFRENSLLTACIAAAGLFAVVVFLITRARGLATATSEAHSQSSVNEARMLAIIRSSMEAIITIDERQNIVIFNPMAERLFGCSTADAIGGSLSRFIPERFRATHERHVEQFGVTGVSDRQMGKQQRCAIRAAHQWRGISDRSVDFPSARR